MALVRTALALAALLAGFPASAAMLVFDNGENFQGSHQFAPNAAPELPGLPVTVDLPTFFDGLGTLTAATLSWNSTMRVVGDAIDGNDLPTSSFTFTMEAGFTALGSQVDTGPFSVSKSCQFLLCDVLGVDEQSSDPNLNLQGSIDITGAAGLITPAPDSFEIGFEPLDIGLLGFLNFDDGLLTGTWDITFTVTYEFDAVPVPAGLLLMPGALLALVAAGCRRRVSASRPRRR